MEICGEEAALVHSRDVPEAAASEIKALRAQMRTLRSLTIGSFALSALILFVAGAMAFHHAGGRKDFLFLSGILGYEVPCKSAVKDVAGQIKAAFKWANETLAAAGADWKDVLSVTSYHVDLHNHDDVFARMREQVLPEPPYPAWTAVGVKSLYFENEVFEMSIIARHQCVGLQCDR
mmetsp:Transcript_90116/g.165393  ORF Transcript_90116/g.165393 Transcript_90116/m.165393 type:complete len:177 (+) Transcript_90116:121-651(+)